MNSQSMIKLIRRVLMSGFASRQLPIRVQQNFSAIKTTAPYEPTFFIHRLNTTPFGWQSRKAQMVAGKALNTQTQNLQTTFQINASVLAVPPELQTEDDKTSYDYAVMGMQILQSQEMLDACKSLGVNVLRVGAVFENWVQDESDNWESEPSFDITLCHKDVLEAPVGKVSEVGNVFQGI